MALAFYGHMDSIRWYHGLYFYTLGPFTLALWVLELRKKLYLLAVNRVHRDTWTYYPCLIKGPSSFFFFLHVINSNSVLRFLVSTVYLFALNLLPWPSWSNYCYFPVLFSIIIVLFLPLFLSFCNVFLNILRKKVFCIELKKKISDLHALNGIYPLQRHFHFFFHSQTKSV
jgi:hypothetical protein